MISLSLRLLVRSAAACGLLVLGLACRPPRLLVQKHTPQRALLVLKAEGATAEEARAASALLAEALGVSESAPFPPVGALRVVRLTLTGRSNPAKGRGLAQTCLNGMGYGLVFGALVASGLPAYTLTSLDATAIGAAAGAVLGLGFGPHRFQEHEALRQKLGYLPWVFQAKWEILDQWPDQFEIIVDHQVGAPLDLRPFLHPLEAGEVNETAIRQASIRAYLEALGHQLKAKN